MQAALTYRTNRDLFSNYYLDEHLPETEEWDEVSDEELREKREEIRKLWDREKGTVADRTESGLEEKFIRPMFRKLGIPFEVEETVQRGQRRPDYGFFPSEDAARKAFDHKKDGGDFYAEATAVADAKRWGRPLDTRGSGEHKRDFENPSYQIHVYLQEVDAAQWAVLTNGRKWRLYYGPTSHRLDSYYEVDLPTILEDGDLDDFKYFYLFFRQEAFLEDAGGDGFLDDVYDESNVFAQELGEDLQDNIYEAIKILSEGYLQYSGNDLEEEDLDLIHDSSLIYLYRLIFVLYAEAEGRQLLDTDNEIYEDQYSLNALKQEVAEELDSADPKYRDWQDNLSSRLDELFSLIDQGSKSQGIPEEDLYIPAYNGGLFRTDPDEDDSDEARFLANHTVGDAYLARVVELLTRSRNGGGKIFVDYSSLDVRHLGSVYEGLLEYQLHVAEEALTLDDGEYVSADEGEDVVVDEGEVYLTTGSGERKATGSYYTPEYVVEYIVDETLGPLVDDIREDLVGQTTYRKGDKEAGTFADQFAERIFELKVLDPAMGSGHFLTSAVDYLAREIIDAQEKQAEQQGIETIDEDQDINWARRKVAQRCIYGVDLNPLATELAKVSLWLRTLAAEQPLAFLDHHLKTGNSLIGSDIEDVLTDDDDGVGTESGQLTLQQSFDRTRQQAIEHVMDRFQDLLSIDNETLEDAKEMEDVYDEVRDDPLYQHLIAMANVHTAEQFGLDVPADAHKRMAEALRDDSWEDIEGQDWHQSAQRIAEDQRFFHWELEFPIAFYKQDGGRKRDAGFDAVIGNPPYLAFQEGSEAVREYFRTQYQTAHRNYDIYVLFVEKAINLLHEEGSWFGYIIPNKFITSQYGEELKQFIPENSQIDSLIDFGDGEVFDDATNYVCIPILRTGEHTQPTSYMKNTNPVEAVQSASLGEDWGEIPVDAMKDWNLLGDEIYQVLSKIETHSELVELSETIFEGARPGGEKVYYNIEEQNVEEEILRPFIKAEDIDPYHISKPEKNVIFPYRKEKDGYTLLPISNFPNTKKYLSEHKADIYGKTTDNSDVEYGYYHVPDHLEDENLILCPDISKYSEFSINRKETPVFPNTVYAIKTKDIPESLEYLVGLLNSSLLETKLKSMSPSVRGGYYRYKTEYLEQLPIRRIHEPAELEDIERISNQYLDGNISKKDVTQSFENDGQVHEFLTSLVPERSEMEATRRSLNMNLLDYLGIPSDELPDSVTGETLGDQQMPVAGIADTPLTKSTEEYDGLRIEGVMFKNDDGRVVLSVDISYKIDEEDSRETDRWNRLAESEFESYEAMAFVGLSEEEETLLREFVPIAIKQAEGFAGFRQDATKTKSPLDRLKHLILPDINEVQTGLEQYIEIRERADELDEKIEKTDRLIDEIVYDLYGLTDEEIEIVEEAVQDD